MQYMFVYLFFPLPFILYPVGLYCGLVSATPKHELPKPGKKLMCSSQSAM